MQRKHRTIPVALALLGLAGAFVARQQGNSRAVAEPAVSRSLPFQPAQPPTPPAPKNTPPPATPARSPAGLPDLALWIREDSLCNDEGKYRRGSDSAPETNPPEENRADLYSALQMANENKARNPCVMALLQKGRSSALGLSRKSENVSCRFLRALLLTDQLDGVIDRRKPSTRELEEGRELLAGLGRADPANGIYPFFELGALKQAEAAGPADKEKTYGAVMDSEGFSDPLIPLYMEMRALGHLNATAFLFAVELFSTSATPDYSHSSTATRELIANDRNPKRPLSWALQVAREMEEIDRNGLVEPSVLLIEIAVIKSLASKAWAVHGSEAVRPRLLTQESWVPFFRRRTQLFMEANDLTVYVDDDCGKTLGAMRVAFPRLVESDNRLAERWRSSL